MLTTVFLLSTTKLFVNFSPIKNLPGVQESDTGLAAPAMWDLAADKERMQKEAPLHVGRCERIYTNEEGTRYVVKTKKYGKYVVELGERVCLIVVLRNCNHAGLCYIEIKFETYKISYKYY